MGRQGVSYEQAKQVFTTILIQGESLSIQRAREAHGSGSNSTWQQHLAKFREEQKGKSIRTLPESFPDELVPMFEQLWVKANEAAENRFEQDQLLAKEKEVHNEKEVKALEDKVNMLNEKLTEALEHNKVLKAEHTQLGSTLNEKEQQYIQINTKNNTQIDSLLEKNKELLTHVDDLKASNNQLSTKHSEAIEELNAKHSSELERAERNEAKWINLYDDEKQNRKSLNHKLDELLKENSTLKNIEKEKISIETELRLNKDQLDKLDLRSKKDEKLNSELLRNNESLKIQLETAKADNLKFVKEVNKLKEKVVELTNNQTKNKGQANTNQ